jgi:hypothetical protein
MSAGIGHFNSESSKNKNSYTYKEKLNYDLRFSLYKDMLRYEPRIWTKNHHLIRLWTNTFTINFTIYCAYKIYYKFYNKNVGFLISLKNSHKMKFVIISMLVIDSFLIYLNYFKLDEHIYDRYYSNISDEDYLKMHESIVTVKKLKQQDHYQVS